MDSTIRSFPTYASLTQTQGWGHAATLAVRGSSSDATVAIENPDQPRYTEGELLGVGGMGKVVLVHDARIGREVAIKQLHTDRELSADDRARFLREARVQGQLEHPSIVPVYDIDQRPDGTTFFTMRRVLGRTLQAILDDLRAGDPAPRARYTQRELLTAFATICLTIDYAHSRGVIHRDLKPANVMLGDFGEVYVLDWGLARLVEDRVDVPADAPAERLSMPGAMMGTPLYMAPEQMADPEVGAAADVFSLGAILFEILTLETLRDARSLYTPVEARPSVRTPARAIAPELETICVRATEFEPKARFASARALQEQLVRYLEGDRELAQRRELAAGHARVALAALARADEPGAAYERERTVAMVELSRAIALDPTDAEPVAALAKIMSTPPRTTPPSVVDELKAAEQTVVRIGAKYSVLASSLWFAFVPLILWMGLIRGSELALVLLPIGLAGVVAAIASRLTRIPEWMQLAVIGLTLLAGVATSRMCGPLVLLPTMAATLAIVIQVHPELAVRTATWILACVAIAAPALLELAGVLPASYAFEGGAGGRIFILPQMHELPRIPTYLMLVGASLGVTIVPCVFIGRLRSALTDAQRQLLVQAWHFRRLGQDLIDAGRDQSR